jgi:hypothetical protein
MLLLSEQWWSGESKLGNSEEQGRHPMLVTSRRRKEKGNKKEKKEKGKKKERKGKKKD